MKMNGYRLRSTLFLGSGFFVLSFCILLAYTGFSIYALVRYQKDSLKAIAKNIAALHFDGVSKGKPEIRIAYEIKNHMYFADKEQQIAAVILSSSGEILLEAGEFHTPIKKKFLLPDDDHPAKMYLLGISADSRHERRPGNGEKRAKYDIEDLFSRWHFLLRRHTPDGRIVLVTNYGHYELVERSFEGLLVCLLVTIVLTFFASYRYAKGFSKPVESILRTLRSVEKGNLKSRVREKGQHAEMLSLIQTLNQTLGTLDESFGRISAFSADAAHELKTPLTAIRGTIEVCLSRERSTEEYLETLGECVDEVAKLSHLVDTLLLLVQPGNRQKLKDNGDDIYLEQSVLQQIGSLDFLAMDKGVNLQYDLDSTLFVHGDAQLLGRLFANLINNAIRFTPPGGTIEIALRRNGENAEFVITDTGCGIDKEHLPRIFDRLYQVEKERTVGSGLGLALVKWVTNYHGGRVSVTSTPGQGSCFTVWLPLVKMDDSSE